ncbi:hypothetical protein BD410DRAFT_901246 [Rickenella mellea]|uniref:DNA damage-binding protein 1 n=1 Tax=Rickenella mellea TaxID=50990 RepID=A0A4Y7PS59_9AGAM|nr:hypothetical protein BD410DRAFT_901246 [Rickenella mellea]
MKVVSTYHAPSSISHSVKCSFTQDRNMEFLVVAKVNKLDVYALLPEGLSLQCTLDVWGRITSLHAISTSSQLLVTTDHPDPKVFLVDYEVSDRAIPELVVSKTLDLYERGTRSSEFFTGALADPDGELAIVSSYVGKLKLVRLEHGRIIRDSDASLRELNVLSMCFLYGPKHHAKVLAILHRDHAQKIVLTSHDISLHDLELSFSPSALLPECKVKDPMANVLIPVLPYQNSSWNAHGGVLVLGGTKVYFYACSPVEKQKKKKKDNTVTLDDLDKKVPKPLARMEWPYSEITAYTQVDPHRFLIGDAFGRIVLLALSPKSAGIQLVPLGTASPPMSLTPLSSQYVFLGSHFGDSQFIRILPDKSSAEGSYLDVLDLISNIAPIVDAVVVDIDDTAQPHIVTCSGGKNSGSLRIIRRGATFTEMAAIGDFPNITDVWPLKSRYHDQYHTRLLVTTPALTSIYALPPRNSVDKDAIRHLSSDDYSGFSVNATTITSANMVRRTVSESRKSEYHDSPYVVQVTLFAVNLIDMDSGREESKWIPGPDREIVVADISPSQICLALSGGRLVLLTIEDDRITQQSHKDLSEISALSIAPLDSSKMFSNYVAVGFWQKHQIQVFSLPNFEPKGTVTDLSCLPRSVLFHSFGDRGTPPQSHILVGQSDGTVAVIPFHKGNVGNKRMVRLGDSPVHLCSCAVDGHPVVIASAGRASIFFWDKESVQHAPVLVKDVLKASYLDAYFWPSSLIFVTPSGLSIGHAEENNNLHIRTISMGLDNPVRIAYSPEANAFGVGCVKTSPNKVNDLEQSTSSFQILDDLSYENLSTHPLAQDEEVTAVSTAVMEHEDNSVPFFCVGSMMCEPGLSEPTRGRILLITVSNMRKDPESLPHIYASSDTRGCVYAFANINGKLAAAVNTGVVLYRLEQLQGSNTGNLIKVAEWNHNYFVTSIVTQDDLLIIGDAISSVAVLQLKDSQLQTVAKDYSPLWPVCLGVFGENTIVGANSDGNLFSFTLRPRGTRHALESDGNYHIDDNVNKFVPGTLSFDSSHEGFTPRQLFFTASGRIGVVSEVHDHLSKLLTEFQRNLAGVIFGPGNLDHSLWRAPANTRGRSDGVAGAAGFLDGDFLENFLNFSPSSLEIAKIMAGRNQYEALNIPFGQIRGILESLQGIH